MKKKKKIHVFLDMDGVVADFDKRAIEVLGCVPRDFEGKEGAEELWKRLYATDHFFLNLEPTPYAFELVYQVRARGYEPTFLTGLPRQDGFMMPPKKQKELWADRHFKGSEIICCPSKDKCLHIRNRGDVIIDDWDKYIPEWTNAGGRFILHTDLESSLKELDEYLASLN